VTWRRTCLRVYSAGPGEAADHDGEAEPEFWRALSRSPGLAWSGPCQGGALAKPKIPSKRGPAHNISMAQSRVRSHPASPRATTEVASGQRGSVHVTISIRPQVRRASTPIWWRRSRPCRDSRAGQDRSSDIGHHRESGRGVSARTMGCGAVAAGSRRARNAPVFTLLPDRLVDLVVLAGKPAADPDCADDRAVVSVTRGPVAPTNLRGARTRSRCRTIGHPAEPRLPDRRFEAASTPRSVPWPCSISRFCHGKRRPCCEARPGARRVEDADGERDAEPAPWPAGLDSPSRSLLRKLLPTLLSGLLPRGHRGGAPAFIRPFWGGHLPNVVQ